MTDAPTTRADHAELAACPFCGGTATIERFGNTRVSTQYHCDDCGCFLETGEEFHHGRLWNRRPREEALLSEIAALRGALAAAQNADAENDAYLRARATQAERQRDEFLSFVRKLDCECDPSFSTASCGRCVQLANQGADQ